MPPLAAIPETSTRILDIAERLVQTRGFNAFSYADIAAALHVTKATLHYHFPTKADLGNRLIERYQTGFLAALGRIDESRRDAGAKLKAYVGIYTDVLDDDRMCLCGMLAADYITLPPTMRDAVRRFFDANEAWLGEALQRGREKNELAFAGSPVEAAQVLVGALEGAMLLARSHGDTARFRSAACRLLADLGVPTQAPNIGAPESLVG
jgi:TetR/AcrR family transcriptional regulator, transcriptional repressor for nem operon